MLLTKADLGAGGSKAEGQERPRLLCVDDSAAMRDQIKDLLRNQYEVVVADDGLDGLRAAKAQPPDVVLCDFEMPKLNGLQLLLTVRNDPVLRSIPFIIITSNTQPQTATKCLNAGADDFISKTASAEELRARVGAALRTYHRYQQLRTEHQDLTRTVAFFAKSEARMRAVIQSASDGIVLLAVDGSIEGLNLRAEKMFGCSQAEVVGQRFLETLFAPESHPALSGWLTPLASSAANGVISARQEVYGLRRGGQAFPAECCITHLQSGAGAELCAFVRDLSEAVSS